MLVMGLKVLGSFRGELDMMAPKGGEWYLLQVYRSQVTSHKSQTLNLEI
jgi:hypothetical protein